MNLLVAIIVVVIIILSNKKNDQQNIQRIVNFCPKCGFYFQNIQSAVNFCPKCGHTFNQNIKLNKPLKEKHTDKEIKNSLIMITGAILIILSAIIFLTSTWHITNNIIKTCVILFMLVVFLAISYFSKEYMKLKQTSKTFYYIALAYIPILLLSISMFSLFGNFLSLYGKGKYIYLAISSILVSVIYYLDFKKHNNKLISIFSVIFQFISVIFLTLIFTNDIAFIYSALFIYSIIFNIIYMNNIIYFDNKTHLNICITLFSILASLVGFNYLFIFIPYQNPYNFITCILLLANMYLLLIKILNKDSIYKFLYPVVIVMIFSYFSYLFDNLMFRQSLILVSFAVVYIYNLARENKINIVTYFEILGSFLLYNMVWMFMGNLLDTYILFAIMSIFSLVSYLYSEKYKELYSSMFFVGIVVTTISIAIKFGVSSILIGYIGLILVLVNILLNDSDKTLSKPSKWVGVSAIILSTIINFNNTIYSVMLFSIFFIIALVYGIIKKDSSYKIMSYIYSNVVLISLFSLLGLNYSIYIIPSITILITFIEILIPSLKDKSSDDYLILSYVLSNIIIFAFTSIEDLIVSLILNSVFIFYIIYYKKNKNNFCIPFIGMIPHLYGTSLMINDFNFMYIISIIAILFVVTLIYSKKSNLYISMFYVYVSCHMIFLEQNKYIPLILLILGTFTCYLIKNNKVKDLFKALLYILCLILYNTILIDLRINHITLFSTGIYIILTILFTRTIFKKYGNGYKVWEYILSIFINLIALGCYSSQLDGVIYVAFLSIVVILSYIFKFGPIFLICLIFIILNVLLLIGSMPWWIYILIIGGVLIGFAIYNEAKDNQKEKVSIKKHLDL